MLNYKQLHYFWCVAKYGGVTRASEQLHITPQTISGQISELEASLGVELFHRKGRRLVLTETGKQAFNHAEEIFQVGRELEAMIKGQTESETLLFKVGISDFVPKSIAYRLLSPVHKSNNELRLICQEDKLDHLFTELVNHKLDLIISDRPLPNGLGMKGFTHLLGESSTAFFAEPKLAAKYRVGFPNSLHKAPMLFPSHDSMLRLTLERWLKIKELEPIIKAEFDDTALMKAFGQNGVGIFPAPVVLAEEAKRQFGVEVVGVVDDLKLRYYAITSERKLTDPSVIAIRESAQHSLFIQKT